jgi:hypothetical protein
MKPTSVEKKSKELVKEYGKGIAIKVVQLIIREHEGYEDEAKWSNTGLIRNKKTVIQTNYDRWTYWVEVLKEISNS